MAKPLRNGCDGRLQCANDKGKCNKRVCKWNEERRGKPLAIRDDKSKPKHDCGGAKWKHDKRVKDFFEVGWFGEGECGGETEKEGNDDGCRGVGKRVESRFDGRDIKDRATTIDEEFGVVVGGKSVLDFATLTTVRFEAEEGTDRERGEGEVQSKQ